MTEILQEELLKVGLQLNPEKSRALTTELSETPLFMEVSSAFVEVLGANVAHKYLGRKVTGNLKQRNQVELDHRIQIAWMRFHKHRDVLLDRNVNIHSRLRFFESVITPTLLYGLHACALTSKQMESLDILQRKMLRRVVGWVRIQDEDWSETMSRMKSRVESALRVYPVEAWSAQFLRKQFRMVCRLSRRDGEWAMRVSRWKPALMYCDARRNSGRPAVRWDDRLNEFVRSHLLIESWQAACANLDFPVHEDAYVQFHREVA